MLQLLRKTKTKWRNIDCFKKALWL